MSRIVGLDPKKKVRDEKTEPKTEPKDEPKTTDDGGKGK